MGSRKLLWSRVVGVFSGAPYEGQKYEGLIQVKFTMVEPLQRSFICLLVVSSNVYHITSHLI